MDLEPLLADIPDPELPFLTIADLGILRSWRVDGSTARVVVTPTYSGCPALDSIRNDITARLADAGLDAVVETQLAPPWTTEWLTDRGRELLASHGVAPPGPVTVPLPTYRPACPQCGSLDTEEISRFGGTACKALWRCTACREPFELLKQH